MSPTRWFCIGSALLLQFVLRTPSVQAAANHVVISEFATRGPNNATEEFIELYNPTSNVVNIGGWKLQYKPAAGSSFSDRATLPANTLMGAHKFYLIMNNSYASPPVVPDFTSSSWGSSTGMADAGHMRIIDASAIEVDRVGWGSTADSPEGGVPAPNHGTTANNNSVERKALATSTADSLASGGAHELLGNGQDTNVNGSDFVVQTHGRHPQNSTSPPEPALSVGGSGTGLASVLPNQVDANATVSALAFTFAQDSAYTITRIAILVPTSWTWSHQASSVALSGPAFASASVSVVAESVFVDNAALTVTDGGSVTVADMVAPSSRGTSVFDVRTAVDAGTLTQIANHPSVRVLELVPIVSVHINDASGVPVAPYSVGAEATVSGVVTANFSTTRTDFYLQDGTAGIDVFSTDLPPFTVGVGDSITVTGSILQFRGLTELQPDFSLMVRHATGLSVPDPMVITCANQNATFHPDYSEPNEGRLIRIDGVTYDAGSSTITDVSGTTNIFVPGSFPAPPAQFDVVGILKQFKPGTPAPGPPYTADYEIVPRTTDDIIAHPGPVLTTTPFEDDLQPTSVRINWNTDVPSSSIVRYGTTVALGDSVVDLGGATTHALTVSGLTAATLYYYSVGSGDGNGTNFSTTRILMTASPPASTGEINAYFNKSVDTSVAQSQSANGNADLAAHLVTRMNDAQRSIDAAFYNLSGTSGTALVNAMIAAKNRGVKVRVICEYDNLNSTFSSISAAGIPLINDRFDPINGGLGLMHNKFVSIDSRGGAPESCWVWTGSWNPTDPGTNDDMQNSIELQDQSLAKTYTMEFEEMWGSSTDTPNASASRFGARKIDNTAHRFAIGGHLVECYFSPSDNVTARIIDRINAAQHSIAFELLTMTRTDISAAIVARKNAGLEVRGDMDDDSDSGSQYAYLVGNGVDVHLKTGVSGLLHHKYCLFDAEYPLWDGTTLTGSHNWSSAAEDNNNENTVIVHDPDITNQYLQEFTARYYQFGGTDSLHVVGVEPIGGPTPVLVSLAQSVPNPVHGRTSIGYSLPARQHVSLRLYDIGGREVRTLVNQIQAPGNYRLQLNVGSLASGMYFYRLATGGWVHQRKMIVR